MTTPLLVTGCGRSGTSLVQKLLDAHPALCVGPQPFPDLFLLAKRRFLAVHGVERPNPVGTRFPGAVGTVEELATFLASLSVMSDDLDDMFASMPDNAGQYLPSLATARGSIRAGRFWDVYDQLLDVMCALMGTPAPTWAGSKETFFEELVPALLDRRGAALVVVRDPRDVLCSFRYGTATEHVGADRPTLFVLRQWRKSVAFALRYDTHPHFATVRFEDVVDDWVRALTPVTETLAIDPFDPRSSRGAPRDERGEPWAGNSSFGRLDEVSTAPVGRWRGLLDASTLAYVEATCGPEMDRMGYERSSTVTPAEAISGFVEPRPIDHPRFPDDYSSSPDAVGAELRRLEVLRGDGDDVDLARWFVFPEVHALLRETYAT